MIPLSYKARLARLTAFALACAALIPAAASAEMAASPFPPSRMPRSGYDRTMNPAVAGGQTVRVDLGEGAGARTLALPRGKSAVVELPVDARDVLVSDPKVADVVLSTPRRIYVMGLTSGQTDAAFMDAAGRMILRLEVRVDQDVTALTQTLGRILPGSSIRAEAVNDSIVLSGEVSSPADADKAVRVAQSYVAKPEQVINMISVAGQEQVMLKVRIVEVNRTVLKQLGMSFQGAFGQVSRDQGSIGTAQTFGVNGSLLGGVTGAFKVLGRDNALTANLAAFERVGLTRTLAEPNLTAVSGESAKFLAGGEFPVPTGQDNTGRVSIEYKPFGVGLGFTPVVLSSGRISLKLSTEVSELSNVGGFTIGNGPGGPSLTVPGLNVRRAETVVELPSGGALMIAGLLQSTSKETLDSLPGLMQLPVLGSLFRSRDFQNNETELVIIVTPYLVKPVRPDQLQTPADGLEIADDATTNLLGRLNKGFGKPAAATAGKAYQGPVGYVVE